MKIKVEVEIDTENEQDLNTIEDVLYYIQDIKEILETKQQNLNKHTSPKNSNNRSK